MPTLITEATLRQQKVLAILPKVTSILSLLGSLYIVYDVMRMPFPLRQLYHRLLLGMSLFDCLATSAFFLTTWPIPPEVFPTYGASGTQQTCTAQGYFAQLAITTVLYRGGLATYYFLVIRMGWREGVFDQFKLGYLFHGLPILFGLGTASIAAAMGLINPFGWDCWIAALPMGCEESWNHGGETTCTRGDNATLYQWLFFYAPLWITILLVATLMMSIVYFFRKQERKNARWTQFAPRNTRGLNGGVTRQSTLLSTTTATLTRMGTGLRSLGSSASFWSSKSDAESRARFIHKKSKQRARQITEQAALYIGSFLLVWTFPTILRIHEIINEPIVYYHWAMLSAFFIPSQGLLNFFIFMLPRFRTVRAERKKQQERQAAMQQEMKMEERSSLVAVTRLENIDECGGPMDELESSAEEQYNISDSESNGADDNDDDESSSSGGLQLPLPSNLGKRQINEASKDSMGISAMGGGRRSASALPRPPNQSIRQRNEGSNDAMRASAMRALDMSAPRSHRRGEGLQLARPPVLSIRSKSEANKDSTLSSSMGSTDMSAHRSHQRLDGLQLPWPARLNKRPKSETSSRNSNMSQKSEASSEDSIGGSGISDMSNSVAHRRSGMRRSEILLDDSAATAHQASAQQASANQRISHPSTHSRASTLSSWVAPRLSRFSAVGHMSIAAVQGFAEDLAMAMKEGDGGLGMGPLYIETEDSDGYLLDYDAEQEVEVFGRDTGEVNNIDEGEFEVTA